jgi:hypothetical protein
MKWADFVLRLLLKPRDRDTISGDLLEEYREEVLPAKGPLLARLWYLRQVVSFVNPLKVGLAMGVAAGTLNLIDTAIEPLADDTAARMLLWLGGLLFIWLLIGVRAARRTQRFRDALIAGVLAGTATMAVFHLAAIVRVNLFLEHIRYRDDWQNLVARFQASDFTSLRAYANYNYISGTPIAIALGAIAGAVSGAAGGAASAVLRTSNDPVSDRRA